MRVSADPADVGLDLPRLGRIDEFLEAKRATGVIPGWSLAIARGGAVAYASHGGERDLESGDLVEHDTLFRIYSMTKPVTAVAAMILYERGAFELNDPVANFIPSFGELQIFESLGPDGRALTVPAGRTMTIRHLLTHTAGLTYGFHYAGAVDEMYRAAGYEVEAPADVTLAEACEMWASLPLLFEPGSEWNYSVATDVLGRVVEILTGQTLGEYFQQQVFEPLGMLDTGFHVQPTDRTRLATLYTPGPEGALERNDLVGRSVLDSRRAHFGGGGLVSTTGDYMRFAMMLANGGALDGVRILGPRTVEFMMANHLPGGADLQEFGRPMQSESPAAGVGQGFGGTVVLDPVAAGVPLGVGEFGWGGAASTVFWIDPDLDVTVVFMTHVLPAVALPIRGLLHQLVRQALIS